MTLRLHRDDVEFRPAGQLRGRSISWLVPQRFALGQLALIDGDPDLGKSCIMLDLAARLSRESMAPERTCSALLPVSASSGYTRPHAESGHREHVCPSSSTTAIFFHQAFTRHR
jgi:hypothetical protein